MKDEKADRLYARYMRMFASLYEISVCGADEIGDVTEFIDRYWKRGHALVRSRELMDWQHFNPVTGTYNFVIARSRETGEIHALEGFIPTSQFDCGITSPMTWGAIWKTRDDVAPAGLGVVVKTFREHECPSAYAMEVGISADASKYNQKLGNTIFELEPWFIANRQMDEYRLLVPDPAEAVPGASGKAPASSTVSGKAPASPSKSLLEAASKVPVSSTEAVPGASGKAPASPSEAAGTACVKEPAMGANGPSAAPGAAKTASESCADLPAAGIVTARDWESLRGAFAPGAIPPFKSHTYYYNRYFAHPIYHYEALLLEDPRTGMSEALFYRIVSAENSRGMFIVDYIGDGSLLSRAGGALTRLLADKSAEYMLFLCSGVSESALLSAGFSDRRKGGAVVPVYYEPFLCRNVDILCTSHGPKLPWPTFKGDADQDRPSVLP